MIVELRVLWHGTLNSHVNLDKGNGMSLRPTLEPPKGVNFNSVIITTVVNDRIRRQLTFIAETDKLKGVLRMTSPLSRSQRRFRQIA